MAVREALIICDMLEDFTAPGAPLEVPAGRDIVQAIAERLGRARSQGTPVVYVNDSHAPDDREFTTWPPHAVEGSPGSRVIGALSPRPGEAVVKKTSYSGFFETELDEVLSGLGVSRIVLTGVVANICILYTAVDAYMRGYEVTVPPDCVAALNPQDHAFALRQLREVLKIDEG